MLSTNDLSYEALTITEKQAYNSYKDNPYALNMKLRKGLNLESSEIGWVNTLSNLILKFYSAENRVLYRATCSDCMDGFTDESGFYINPAFMSTATSLKDAANHAVCYSGLTHVIMELHCSIGTLMLPMDANPAAGHSEAEMLLNKNSVWQITEKKDITSFDEIQRLLGLFRGKSVKVLTKYTMNFICYNP